MAAASQRPQFRSVVGGDVDVLTELFLDCFNRPPWNDGWSPEAARERLGATLEARNFVGYVAALDGCVVGMLLGQKELWVARYHFAVQEMCVAHEPLSVISPGLRANGLGMKGAVTRSTPPSTAARWTTSKCAIIALRVGLERTLLCHDGLTNRGDGRPNWLGTAHGA